VEGQQRSALLLHMVRRLSVSEEHRQPRSLHFCRAAIPASVCFPAQTVHHTVRTLPSFSPRVKVLVETVLFSSEGGRIVGMACLMFCAALKVVSVASCTMPMQASRIELKAAGGKQWSMALLIAGIDRRRQTAVSVFPGRSSGSATWAEAWVSHIFGSLGLRSWYSILLLIRLYSGSPIRHILDG